MAVTKTNKKQRKEKSDRVNAFFSFMWELGKTKQVRFFPINSESVRDFKR